MPPGDRERWSDDRIDDLRDDMRQGLAAMEARLNVRIDEGNLGCKERFDQLDVNLHDFKEKQAKNRKDAITAWLAFAGPVTVAIIGGAVALITHAV